jgi:hypothetical protein
VQIPTQKQKYEKNQSKVIPPKLKNSTVINSNDNETDEISGKEFFK